MSIHAISENYEYKLLTKIYMTMEKNLFLCASLFLAQSINAQISQKPSLSLNGRCIYVNNAVLGADDIPIIYTVDYDDDKNPRKVAVFDTNFSVIKEFSFPFEAFEQIITSYRKDDNGAWVEWGSRDSYAISTPAFYEYFNPSISVNKEAGYITQTFFNDDDSYEYILPLIEKGHFEYTQEEYGEYYKNVIDGYCIVGVKVVNDKGVEVCSVKTDAMTAYKDLELCMYSFGTTNYIEIGDGVYKVDKTNTSLTKVAMPAHFSVSPTVARRNTLLNVSFDASDSPRAIKVISGNGMECQKINVAPGTESVGVDTSRLSPGVYVVMMSEGGKNVEKCKIVVR